MKRWMRWVLLLIIPLLTACGGAETEEELVGWLDGIYSNADGDGFLFLSPNRVTETNMFETGIGLAISMNKPNMEDIQADLSKQTVHARWHGDEALKFVMKDEGKTITYTNMFGEETVYSFYSTFADASPKLLHTIREKEGIPYADKLVDYLNTMPLLSERGIAVEDGNSVTYISTDMDLRDTAVRYVTGIDISRGATALFLIDGGSMGTAAFHPDKKNLYFGVPVNNNEYVRLGGYQDGFYVDYTETFSAEILPLPRAFKKKLAKTDRPLKHLFEQNDEQRKQAAAEKTEKPVKKEVKHIYQSESSQPEPKATPEQLQEAVAELTGTYRSEDGTLFLVVSDTDYQVVNLADEPDSHTAMTQLAESRTEIAAQSLDPDTRTIRFASPTQGTVAWQVTDTGFTTGSSPFTGSPQTFTRIGDIGDYMNLLLDAVYAYFPPTLYDYLVQPDQYMAVYGEFSNTANGVVLSVTNPDIVQDIQMAGKTGVFNDIRWYGLLQELALATALYPETELWVHVVYPDGAFTISARIEGGTIENYLQP